MRTFGSEGEGDLLCWLARDHGVEKAACGHLFEAVSWLSHGVH